MDKYKVGMVSLGCDKNRVDSEMILGTINKFYEITSNPKEADIIIVNTCGFIDKAKQESIDTILEMAEYKKNYKCKMLIATGCLTQRYGEELLEQMPEIDILMGVNDYMKLHKLILEFIKEQKQISANNYSDEGINEGIRILTTNKHTAYVRIAEGCDNFCTYCIIPKIRGRFRSRKPENILTEVKGLVDQGVKEVILIAQDLTSYGLDIYGEKKLHSIVRQISEIDGVEWIRLLYCYPEAIYEDLIDEISTNDKVVKYLDIPIQHISDRVLKLMGRRTTKKEIINTINELRKRITGITLRTSIIVGFPNESEADFNQLEKFIKEFKLENVGVFTYSQEENTPAAKMDGQIEDVIKELRLSKLMKAQKSVAKQLNELKIGRIYDIIIDSSTSEYYVGRNYQMAPDIDGLIYIKKNKSIKVGDFVKVKITDILEYDLIGEVLDEFSE